MALVIEDGSVVDGANSYSTAAELVSYAADRGLDIPADEPTQERLLILATDYLLSREAEFKGVRVNQAQVLAYPRNNVVRYNFQLANDVVPQELKNAQMEAAVAANSGELLVTNLQQADVQSEKVDVLERSYFRGGNWSTVRVDRVNAYLAPLLKGDSNTVLRV